MHSVNYLSTNVAQLLLNFSKEIGNHRTAPILMKGSMSLTSAKNVSLFLPQLYKQVNTVIGFAMLQS